MEPILRTATAYGKSAVSKRISFSCEPNCHVRLRLRATPMPSASPTNVVAVQPEPQVKRTVTIKTPLYEAKVDSTGAEVVSWIIKKNKDSGREIHSVAGNKNNPVPLELVSPEGLKRQPRQVPLQVLTGDGALDATLSSSSYVVGRS